MIYIKYAIFKYKNTLYKCKGIKTKGTKIMRNDYEEMMTAQEYAQTMKAYNPAEENAMMTVEDYAKSVQNQCVEAQVSNMITVREYAKAMNDANYVSAEEKEMIANLEEFLSTSKQAQNDAQTLEKLFG